LSCACVDGARTPQDVFVAMSMGPRVDSGPHLHPLVGPTPSYVSRKPHRLARNQGWQRAPTVRAGPGPQGMHPPQAPRLRCHMCGNYDANHAVSSGAMAGASVCGLCMALEGLQTMANNVASQGPARDHLTQALACTLSDLETSARRYRWQLPPPPEQYGLGLIRAGGGADICIPCLPTSYSNSGLDTATLSMAD